MVVMTRSCYTIAVYKGKGEGTPLAEKIRQTVFDLFPWTNIMIKDRNETIQEIRVVDISDIISASVVLAV